jgi:hypothetical protein
MRSERVSDQTSTGWELELRKGESGGNQRPTQDDKGGVECVPLSGAEVVVVSYLSASMFGIGPPLSCGGGRGLEVALASSRSKKVRGAKGSERPG